jgi:hypothetical protein
LRSAFLEVGLFQGLDQRVGRAGLNRYAFGVLLQEQKGVLIFDTSRTLKQFPDGDFEFLEQARRGLPVRLPAAHEFVFTVFEEEHLHCAGFGVDQPVSPAV